MTKLKELEELEKMAWQDFDKLSEELKPRLDEARTRWLIAAINKTREETRVRLEAEVKAETTKDKGVA